MFKKLFVSGVVATALTVGGLGGVASAHPKEEGKRQDAAHKCTSGKSADNRQDGKGDRAAKRQNADNRCKAKKAKQAEKREAHRKAEAERRAEQAEKREARSKA